MKYVYFILIFSTCLFIGSCGNRKTDSAPEKPCDCSKITFYPYFATEKDMSGFDSIRIEKYLKGGQFHSVISSNHRILSKEKLIQTYPKKGLISWELNFGDSLSSQYDYRLILYNHKDTLRFDLTKIRIREVTIGGIIPAGQTQAHSSRSCLIDSVTINGRTQLPSLGRITIKLD